MRYVCRKYNVTYSRTQYRYRTLELARNEVSALNSHRVGVIYLFQLLLRNNRAGRQKRGTTRSYDIPVYEGNSEDESRKILIDGRDAETRGKRDAPTREIEGTRGTRVRAASLGKGKKSRRRMDYRGASKDGTMEAKTETSLTGSRLPGRESTWPTGALELPGSSVSTCLPLPSILLSLFLPFSRFSPPLSSFSSSSIYFFLFFLLLLLLYLSLSLLSPFS